MRTTPSKFKLNAVQAAVLAAFGYDEEKDSYEISDPNDSGYQVSWWGRDNLAPERIYFKTARRDCKAFIAFENVDQCQGPTLHVTVYNPDQPLRWIESQTAILRAFYFPALAGLNRILADMATKLPAPSFRDHAEDAEFTTPNLPVVQ